MFVHVQIYCCDLVREWLSNVCRDDSRVRFVKTIGTALKGTPLCQLAPKGLSVRAEREVAFLKGLCRVKIKLLCAAFYASVKCGISMLHGRQYVATAIAKIYYPLLNLLVACRYSRREKRSDTNGFFQQNDFLHCKVSH